MNNPSIKFLLTFQLSEVTVMCKNIRCDVVKIQFWFSGELCKIFENKRD